MYYSLFLGLCIFIFVALTKYGIRLLLTEERELNGAQILYGVAVGIMIFGLLSMSIVYLARNIWWKIKGQTHFQGAKHAAKTEARISSPRVRNTSPRKKK